MSNRDWDAELKKIDAEIAKASSTPTGGPGVGAKPGAGTGGAGTAGAPAGGAAVGRPAPALPSAGGAAGSSAATTGFGVYARLTLAVAVAVGIVFWPYAARCGIGLAGYLSAVGVVIVSGVWSAVWTFRHRAGKAHVLSLLLVLWGLVLAGLDVLPRVGYAVPTVEHPAGWSCS